MIVGYWHDRVECVRAIDFEYSRKFIGQYRLLIRSWVMFLAIGPRAFLYLVNNLVPPRCATVANEDIVKYGVQGSEEPTAARLAGLIRGSRARPDASVSAPVVCREHLDLGPDRLSSVRFGSRSHETCNRVRR